ncbi:hypothetical protein [Mycolicibacterium gilvum]|jgi:hypothetical protein|uniref:Uncharacterized protein n=1 Tax=Mycolicibacterium gilvum TaxID=1804 RepID=A0A378SFZ5_9MYCO|nr:hypothetical protein [Mycolicibacterium gilvum]STZ41782.1 Uncharacterised protein [Mycolicibacterium gilvum]
MPEPARTHAAKLARPGANVITPLQGFDALNQIVNATRECIAVHQVEKTKRARLEVYETTEIARIKAAESVLRDYFAQIFAERRANFEELFTRLDTALEAQDGETINLVVRGIVDIAKSSPLADLGDLGKIREALDDPNQVWEF